MKKILSALAIVIAAAAVGCSAGDETTPDGTPVVERDGYVARTTESGSSIVAHVESTDGTPLGRVSYDRATGVAGMVLEARASSIAVRLERAPSVDEMGGAAIALVRLAAPRSGAPAVIGSANEAAHWLDAFCVSCTWDGGYNCGWDAWC